MQAPARLTFVTGNAGKLRELRLLVAPLGIEVIQDSGGYTEIQADSLAEVTATGAAEVADRVNGAFVLEDSGLFVSALRGFPGVYSRHALDTIGTAGILRLMVDVEQEMRQATFQTHLLYVDGQGVGHGFDGLCKGSIAERARGRAGFGFDPIFVPDGQDRTFAEMDEPEKNAFSHRGQAVRAFLATLSKTAVR